MSSSSEEKDPSIFLLPASGAMAKKSRSKVILPVVLILSIIFVLLFGLVIGGDFLRRRLLRVEEEVASLKASYKSINERGQRGREATRSDEIAKKGEVSNSVQTQATHSGQAESADNVTGVSGPSIYVSPKSLTVKIGHQANMYCHVSGAWPKADITWSRLDGGLGGVQVVTSETSKLLINSAVFTDAGVYVCRAQNALGTVQEAVEVVVEVTVQAFHEVALECPIAGDLPGLHWTKEMGALPEGHSKVKQNKLLVNPVHAEDAGTYVCTARGLSARIKLTVTENDCTIFDFEHGIKGWKKTGSVFNNQPTYGDNPTARNRGQPSNHQGDYWIGGAEHRPSPEDTPGKWQWDGPQGTLTSPPFKIKGHTIKFLIGGGCDISVVRAELLVKGKVVKRMTGECHETMKEKSWDVRSFKGKEAQLRLIDNSSGGWGHINFDNMVEICDNN